MPTSQKRPPCHPADYHEQPGPPPIYSEICVRLRYWSISGIHTPELPADLTLVGQTWDPTATEYGVPPRTQMALTNLKEYWRSYFSSYVKKTIEEYHKQEIR